MSFRVWFLRMVWVVAAAVALSGCDSDDEKDKEKEGTDPSGDEAALAVAFDPAAPAAGAEGVKVVVTVTGDADGKINIGVKCGETDTLEAKDYDVTDGKATSDAFNAPAAADAKVTCTATASGKVGGEDETGTGSFDIAAAGSGGDDLSLELTLTDEKTSDTTGIQIVKSSSGDEIFTVAVAIKKGGAAAEVADLSGYSLEVSWSCNGGTTDNAGDDVKLSPAGADDLATIPASVDVNAHDTAIAGCTLTGTLKHSDDTSKNVVGAASAGGSLEFSFVDSDS